MANDRGIKQGLNQSLRQYLGQGLNSGAEVPLFTFEPEPVYQDLSVSNLIAKTGATPMAAYLGNGTDVVGSEDLTASGTMLEDQPARGLWDGSSIDGYGAMEATGSTGGMDAAANTFLSIDKDTSFAVLLVARMPSGLYGTLASKRSGGSGQGWRVLSDSNGNLTLTYALTEGSVTTANIAGTDDGRWQFILAGHNATADVAYCYNDKDEKSASTSALTGTAENTAKFSLFDGDTPTKTCVQITSAYVFTGADAETILTNRALLRSAWWTHGTDSTGKLTTYTRTGSQYTFGPDDATGATVLPWGTGATAQKAIGYDRRGTGGYGLAVNSVGSVTNLNAYSEPDAANWLSDGSPTMAYLDRNNMLGFGRAAKITATGVNDLRKRTFTSTAGVRSMVSCFVEWDGTGSPPELVVYNATDGIISPTANSVHTGSPMRQRLYLAWVPTASETQNYGISPTDYGVGSSGYCWFDGMQLETTSAAGPSVFTPTAGATATTNVSIPISSGLFSVPADSFRAQITASYTGNVSGQILKLKSSASTTATNERMLSVVSGGMRGYFYNAAAALVGTASTAAVAALPGAITTTLQVNGAAQLLTCDGVSVASAYVLDGSPVLDSVKSGADVLWHSIKIYRKSGL